MPDTIFSDSAEYLWIAVGILVLAALVLVLNQYLGWVVFGIFMYYLSRPVARWLRKFLDSRSLTAFLSLFLIAVPIVVVLGVFLATAIGQLNAVLGGRIGELVMGFFPEGFNVAMTPEEFLTSAEGFINDPGVRSLLGSASGFLGSFATSAYSFFLSLILVFFLLKEDARISAWLRSNFLEEGSLTEKFLEDIDTGLNSVYFGYTLTIFAIILLTIIIYNVFNFFAPQGLLIPQVVLLAFLTGLFTLVPLVGRSIVYLGITLYLSYLAYEQQNLSLLWFPILFFLFMSIAFDNLVRVYIRPYLSGRLFDTSLVMFAYLLGPPLFGWYGIFLGPFLMVVSVNFIRNVLPEIT